MDIFGIFVPVLVGFGGIFFIYNKSAKSRKINSILATAAQKYQCTFIKGDIFSFPKIYGTTKAISLRVEKTRENKENYLRIKIKYTSLLEGHIIIKKENTFSRLKNKVGVHDIQTGDKSFDDKMLISASSAFPVAAFLRKEERIKISNAATGTVNFKAGNSVIEASYLTDVFNSPDMLCERIDIFITIAKAISRKINIKERLIENIHAETIPAVITNNIIALTKEYKNDKETKRVLKKALTSDSIAVQTEAAQHLGAQGMQHLCAVLKETELESVSLKIKIIKILGHQKYKKSTPLLKKEYHRSANSKKQLAILKTFQYFEDKKIEPFLIEQLENKETDLRHAAIEALGTCGTVAAAEKLYHLAKNSMNPFTKNTAQKAIGQIQARLGDVEKGWLSFSEVPEKEGALSISQNSTEGALSLDSKGEKK